MLKLLRDGRPSRGRKALLSIMHTCLLYFTYLLYLLTRVVFNFFRRNRIPLQVTTSRCGDNGDNGDNGDSGDSGDSGDGDGDGVGDGTGDGDRRSSLVAGRS